MGFKKRKVEKFVTRIDSLTEEQKAQLKPWADKWIAIGLSTERVDYEKAGNAIKRCYAFAELPEPEIIRARSPLEACTRGPVIAGERELGRPLTEPEKKKIIQERWHHYLGGNLWAWWTSYESFFREVCHLKLKDDLSDRGEAYAEFTKQASWTWCGYDFVVISDRPKHILRDPQGRLHSLEGKAIEWPDGWGLYMVHGTQVPAEWIEDKESLTPEKALREQNIELRRAAMEIVGWGTVLEKLNARVVDEDSDPAIGTLLVCDLPGASNEYFLRVRCATGRDFILPVPPAKTALEANAATYGLTSKEYRQLEVRT